MLITESCPGDPKSEPYIDRVDLIVAYDLALYRKRDSESEREKWGVNNSVINSVPSAQVVRPGSNQDTGRCRTSKTVDTRRTDKQKIPDNFRDDKATVEVKACLKLFWTGHSEGEARRGKKMRVGEESVKRLGRKCTFNMFKLMPSFPSLRCQLLPHGRLLSHGACHLELDSTLQALREYQLYAVYIDLYSPLPAAQLDLSDTISKPFYAVGTIAYVKIHPFHTPFCVPLRTNIVSTVLISIRRRGVPSIFSDMWLHVHDT
ncbi:hypothetical protein C8J57DRAFT_1221624 [Mycena rebaudengoi]|nr:hypothetical protein C8J57DRAFT_1221624 [Mycena rebaudengoi]